MLVGSAVVVGPADLFRLRDSGGETEVWEMSREAVVGREEEEEEEAVA